MSVMTALSQPQYTSAEYSDDKYDGSWNANFSNPFCFFPSSPGGIDDDPYTFFKTRLLTATMSDLDYIRLASSNVQLYMSIFDLRTDDQINFDLVTEWLQGGCDLWIRVAKGRDIPTLDIGKDDFLVYQFLREFDSVQPSGFEESLINASENGILSEQDFIDWYMSCKHTLWKNKPSPPTEALAMPPPPIIPKQVIDPFALTSEELKYIRDNTFPGVRNVEYDCFKLSKTDNLRLNVSNVTERSKGCDSHCNA